MNLILPLVAPPIVRFGECDLENGALNFKIDPSHDLWIYDGGASRADFEKAFASLVSKWKNGRRIDFSDAWEARRLVQKLVDEWWAQGYSRNYHKREVVEA